MLMKIYGDSFTDPIVGVVLLWPRTYIEAEHHKLFLQRDGVVSLLAGGPDTLDIEYRTLTRRSRLDDILELVDRTDLLVVDDLDDEAAVDTGLFEGTIVDFRHDEAVVDTHLFLLFGVDRTELGTENIEVCLFDDGRRALRVLQRDGLAVLVLVMEIGDGDLVTGFLAVDDLLQLTHLRDLLTVDIDDDIILLQTGSGTGAIRIDTVDIDALVGTEVYALAVFFLGIDIVEHVTTLDTEPCTLYTAILLNIADDLVHDGRRNGEAITCVTAGRRVEHGVDADELATRVDEGTAGVTGVDSGIGLDERGDTCCGSRLVDAAAFGTDDTGGDGAVQTVGVTDGDDPLADLQVVTVADRQGGEVLGIDLDEGEVGDLVGTNDPCGELAVVVEGDGQLVGAFYDMVIGDDISVRADDDTTTRGFLLRRLHLLLAGAAVALVRITEEAEGIAEEVIERIALYFNGLSLGILDILDMYDSRESLAGGIGKVYGLTGSCYGRSLGGLSFDESACGECQRSDTSTGDQILTDVLCHNRYLYY